MKGLVFIKPVGSHMEPFTTSEIIAHCAGIHKQTVSRLVRKHQSDLEEFGQVGFEIRAVKRERDQEEEGISGFKIRKSNGAGRPEKLWHFNEQQATLFITCLQNTEAVRAFKKDLVREFFAMRKELEKRRVLRQISKPTRRSLTDALRDSGEDERMHGHSYGTYTDLVYKAAFGKTARQLRAEREAPRKTVLKDFLTSEELPLYEKKEAAVTVLLDAGMRYGAIRDVLLKGADEE